jgi:ATP-dependent helicase/nuclease subunit A
MDWLGPALMRHMDGQSLAEYGGCKPEILIPADEDCHFDITLVNSTELIQPEEQIADAALLDRVKNLEPLPDGAGTGWVDRILGWQYSHQVTVDKPAKMSVTVIKRRFESINSGDGERMVENNTIYDQPRFIQTTRKLTAAELGTAMHTVMQHVDLQRDLSVEGLKTQVEALVRKEILLPEHAAQINLTAVAEFFKNPLGQRMLAANYLKREIPFSLMLPAAQFYPEMKGSEEKIFVQGVIDCLFREQDRLVLLDYKTDRKQNSAADLKAKYGIQLDIYAQAVQTIFKEKVKEKYLYVFSTGETVNL